MKITDEIVGRILDAIHTSDLDSLKTTIDECPEGLKFEASFVVNWLHYAAQFSEKPILEYLVGCGLPVNMKDPDTGEKAINHAASNGMVESVECLLTAGSDVDDTTILTNPLFSAVLGASTLIVQMLLENGADGKKRYSSNRKIDIDAVAFAVERGELEIAKIIAMHNSNNDPKIAIELIKEANEIANKNTV